MVLRDDNKLLFCDGDLSEALRIHFSKIQDKVDAIPEDRFRSMSDNEIFQELQADLSITPLELDEASRSMTKEETKVDVSDYGRDIHVDGIRVTISIPFHGDPQLWRMRPNNWRSTFPEGNIRFRHGSEKGMLQILIERPADEGSERIKKIYENNLDDIRFYLSSQKRQIETECARLPEQIRNAIISRRTRLGKHKDLSEILDVPLKKEASDEVPSRSEDNNSHRVSKPKGRYQSSQAEWDVFVSHASEDKDSFVRPLAEALRLRDLRVWYDEFSLKVGDSLRRSIDRGLSKSRYGVVVISPDFLRKEWPQKELDGLVAKEVDGQKVILPVWHNVDAKTIRSYSPMLADRVATSSKKGLEQVVNDLLAGMGED